MTENNVFAALQEIPSSGSFTYSLTAVLTNFSIVFENVQDIPPLEIDVSGLDSLKMPRSVRFNIRATWEQAQVASALRAVVLSILFGPPSKPNHWQFQIQVGSFLRSFPIPYSSFPPKSKILRLYHSAGKVRLTQQNARCLYPTDLYSTRTRQQYEHNPLLPCSTTCPPKAE